MAASSWSPAADLRLLPGFRFQPTGEELVVDYMKPRIQTLISGSPSSLSRNLMCSQWSHVDSQVIPFSTKANKRTCIFFSPRLPTSKESGRTSLMAGSGFWQGNGRDNHIAIKTKVSGAIEIVVIGCKTQLTFMASNVIGYE